MMGGKIPHAGTQEDLYGGEEAAGGPCCEIGKRGT
jgi:hypothetical protein